MKPSSNDSKINQAAGEAEASSFSSLQTLKLIDWSKCGIDERKTILERPQMINRKDQEAAVSQIIDRVRKEGDRGLEALSLEFDKVRVTKLEVPKSALKEAYLGLPQDVKVAYDVAAKNISTFHEREQTAGQAGNFELETQPGIRCGKRQVPISKVGFYIPGGLAPLPSTVFMLAIPARIAACKERVLCTPPQKNGEADPFILAAAYLTGVDRVFCVGGAQAIAAMAYGTESVPKVDKIFGPGNSWVTIAKQMVALDAQGASCDMPAGPSEVLVIATKDSNPDWVAMDLLSQAEHGPDSQVILISTSEALGSQCIERLSHWIKKLSRAKMAVSSLSHSALILCDSLGEAIEISNDYAPEHLILNFPISLSEEGDLLNKITSAGSVFIGPWTPESLGDYASGTNHVLPTGGFASSYSGLGVAAFQKVITYQSATAEGLGQLGPVVEILAEVEGLTAHKMAVTLRRAELKGQTDGA